MKIVRFLSLSLSLSLSVFLLVVSIFCFTSCSNDEVGLNEPGVSAGNGTMTVYVQSKQSATRGIPTESGSPEENKIHLLEFYVFNYDGSFDKYIEIPADNSNEYTFSVTAGTGKTVLVAANMGLTDQGRGNLTAVRAAISEKVITDPTEIPSTGIPMAGEMTGVSVAPETVERIDVSLSRTFSKINAPKANNATVELEETGVNKLDSLELIWGGGALQGEVKFDYKGYVVINGLKRTFAFPNYNSNNDEFAAWDENVWTIGNNVNHYTASEYTNNQLGKVYSGDSFLTDGGVYLYENSPHRTEMNDLGGFDPATVYALIIEADLYDSLNPTNNRATRYWRINIAKTGDTKDIYRILRNAIYNVSIGKVKTIGYGTPGEAEGGDKIIPDVNEAGIEAHITVEDWRVFSEEDRDI